MAISKDSLEVKITVENKEAQKSIKSINDTIDTLGNTTKYSNKEIMELDNKLSHVSNTTTEAVSSFDDLKKTINQAGNTQEITKLTKELEYLSNLQINKNIKPNNLYPKQLYDLFQIFVLQLTRLKKTLYLT